MSSVNYMQEKSPLLPVNNEEDCPRIQCYKNKDYKKKYKRQSILFLFFVIVFFIQNAYQDKLYKDLKNSYRHHNNNDININSHLSIQNVADIDGITLYNKNQMDTFASPFVPKSYYICNDDKASIPYTGLSKFEFNADEFSGLSIKQSTNNHHGASFSIGHGETIVYEDSSISKVTVEINLKFNIEELQDIFWIEKTEDAENQLYSLTIKSDENYGGSEACVIIDVIVRVPHSDSLEKFALSLANNGITFGEHLAFKEISTAVANGNIQFDQLTTGKTSIAIANGHVTGTIKTLSDDLHVSIANGHTDIKITEIDQSSEDHLPIKVEVANGHVDLQVPTSFDSRFDLSSFVGRRIVESSKPEDIHRQQSGKWGVTSGYYGNNPSTKNTINLSASSGSLHLNYA